MSRFSYGPTSQQTPSSKSPNGFSSPSIKGERQDDRGSHSGSEDGSYALYNDQHKIEGDTEEEANTALTSQTLNADGTPKRPMNAFMIFARRRRPQVSAENQAMRTGEISKILSKEWVSMPPSEKQFYLEQAKQLKETFNSKYPDYVYRRRPNNSRKRRRSDSGSMRTGDSLDGDMAGGFDLDASPTDGDASDSLDPSVSPSYPRSSQDIPQNLVDHKFHLGQPRQSIGHHPYHHPETSFRSNGHDNSRLSFSGPTADRAGQSINGSNASPRMPIGGMQYPYNHGPSHQQSSSVFNTESVSPQQGWQSRGSGSNWLGSHQDRLPASLGQQKNSQYSSSPTSWSSPTESSSAASNSQSNSSNFFPTLSTPFYPNQPHFPTSSPTSAPHSVPPQSTSSPNFDTIAGIPSSSLSRDYPPRGYSSSTSMSSNNSYPPSSAVRDPLSYPQRTLPPVQTGSYSHSQPPSSSSSGHSNPPAFWRD